MIARVPRVCLTMIVLLLSVPSAPAASAAPAAFPDVPADAPHAEAVRELVARGIVRGYPDGRFGPEDALLRAQTAVTLVRALGLPAGVGARSFSDQGETDGESWAAVRLLADRDIARGFPDGTFRPAGPLTRQQAISLVSRTLVGLGRWRPQPAAPLFGDVAGDHLADVATYVRYVGGVADTAGPTPDAANPLGAATGATRGWYAALLWAALRPPQAAEGRPAPVPTATPTPGSTPRPTPVAPAAPPPAIPPPAPTPPATPVPAATPLPPPATGGYQRGVNLAGAEFGAGALPGIHGVDYTYPTAAGLDYYRGQGLTLLRLPFRWERAQRGLYAPLDGAELGRLDQVVAAARARGMRVILDPHNYARYHGDLIGSAAVPNAAFADFWRRLADHYRDEPAIWAYGLMNEPHDTGGRWPAAAQAGVDGIRAVDRTHRILVPGDQWSGAWSWQQANAELRISDPADNFMFEAHQYFDADGSGAYAQGYDAQGAYPTVGVERVRPFVEWLQARGARGFLGEYGVPDDDPRWLTVLDTFLSYLDANGISGTYWAGGPWWGDYALSVEPRDGQDRPQLPVLTRHLGR